MLLWSKPISLCYAQETSIQEDGIIKSLSVKEVYDNHNELLRLLHIAREKKYSKAELRCLLALQKDYLTDGNFIQSLIFSKQTEALALAKKDYKVLFETFLYRANIKSNIGLFNEAKSDLDLSLYYNKNLLNTVDAKINLIVINTQFANLMEQKNVPDSVIWYSTKCVEALETLQNVPMTENQKYDYYYYLVYGYINLGSSYAYAISPPNNNLAEKYLLMGGNTVENAPIDILDARASVFSAIGLFYLKQKSYSQALTYYEKAQEEENQANDISTRLGIYKGLQDVYHALGNVEMQNKYLLLYSKTNDQIAQNQQKTLIQETRAIVNKREVQLALYKKRTFQIGLVTITLGLLIVYYLYKRREKSLIEKYKLLTKQLTKDAFPVLQVQVPSSNTTPYSATSRVATEKTQPHPTKAEPKVAENVNDDKVNDQKMLNNPQPSEPSPTEQNHSDLQNLDSQDSDIERNNDININIASDTEEKLLKRIETFENQEKYLKSDISLSTLAHQWKTNTKYLSSLIKTHRGLSFSAYINKLRINYIVNQLSYHPEYRSYKISYLASECGYASSQVFVSAFKKETGLTPSFFIEQLKNDKDRQ